VSDEAAVVVENVSKRFRIFHERNQSLKAAVMRRGRARYEEFWALDDVSFEVPRGTTFGLIGTNGSGKSTLLKCMARILTPEKGRLATKGKVSALLELGSGFHPELSGRDNIFLNGSILGLTKKEITRRFDEIVDFAGPQVERLIDTPVKNYSSGMYVRLGFSVAINVDPDLLLIDEVLAVGDESFQRKCTDKFADLKNSGRTIVVVSHAMGSIKDMCDRVALLEQSKLIDVGPPSKIVEEYLGGVEEYVRPDGEYGQRFGQGGASIDAVEILDRQGQPLESVKNGDFARFRIHYSTEHPIEQPVFRLEIHDIFGPVIAGANTKYHRLVPPSVDGSGFVDYVVDQLMLVEGIYDISATFFDFSCAKPYDVRQRFMRFHVERGQFDDYDGFVSLGGRFQSRSLNFPE
jgi:ABC-type polysaccharide/polyol phosphate transport system ATPase subunit